MTFTSPLFLFFFLPITLILYFIIHQKYRKYIALAASLVFFTWNQYFYLPIMVLLIVINFWAGKSVEQQIKQSRSPRTTLVLAILCDLALLVFFKLSVINDGVWIKMLLPAALSQDMIEQISRNTLPLGLSYITFQAISYLFDVYNEVCESEKRFLSFALYIFLFPKIITGPIVRYRDIAAQLENPQVTSLAAANGIRRFIQGFAKKVLIADTIAKIVNPAFALSSPSFPTGYAWLVLVGYTLQLYFDFSGYTDMAIGLGQAMGFRFMENFNYPYISKSIGEFWRRWHISLSSWFRDYVFYPLEFSRPRSARFRQSINIMFVFLLTGLWHGMTLNYVIWGLIHGAAIALEMTGFGRKLKEAWAPLQHFYTLSIVMLGWIFFRSFGIRYAVYFIARLFGWQGDLQPMSYSLLQPLPIVDHSVWLAMICAVILSMPAMNLIKSTGQAIRARFPAFSFPLQLAVDLTLLLLLFASTASMVGSIRVASIYGNF